MANTLSIARLISVAINLSPAGAQAQNLNNALILGSSDVIDVVARKRDYSSIDDVALDFGSTYPEYLAAEDYFSQSPQPTSLSIGRWAMSATAGLLVGATLSTTQQEIATWQAVTAGSFDVTIDGTPETLTALDFSGDTSLNGVASTITTALAGAGTCTWNSNYQRFQIESATTGATSSVSFVTAGSTNDISTMLGMLSTDSGAYTADGIAAETALAAVEIFDTNMGMDWYGLTIPEAQDSDHLDVAGYIEAATIKHLYGVSTQETGVLTSTDSTNIAYQLQQLAYNRTFTQYSSSSAYSAASLLGRMLTVDYNGNNTVIDLMYKDEPGIVAETLNTAQIDALEGFSCNVFVAYNNNTAIIEKGVVASGVPIDVMTGVDWLAVELQTDVYNEIYTSTTKVAQTDAGMHRLVTRCENRLGDAVLNGLLAPGQWNSGGFGALSEGDFLHKGYYVYAAPVSTQAQADRTARKSVPIQIAAKLAGSIETVDVQLNINR